MPPLKVPEEFIRIAIKKVADYISEQRVLFQSKAKPIPKDEKAVLQPFFPADVLDEVKVVREKSATRRFTHSCVLLGSTICPRFQIWRASLSSTSGACGAPHPLSSFSRTGARSAIPASGCVGLCRSLCPRIFERRRLRRNSPRETGV